MEKSVLEKINRIEELAKISQKGNHAVKASNLHSDDSLSHAVRNAREASIFQEELDVAIRNSRKK